MSDRSGDKGPSYHRHHERSQRRHIQGAKLAIGSGDTVATSASISSDSSPPRNIYHSHDVTQVRNPVNFSALEGSSSGSSNMSDAADVASPPLSARRSGEAAASPEATDLKRLSLHDRSSTPIERGFRAEKAQTSPSDGQMHQKRINFERRRKSMSGRDRLYRGQRRDSHRPSGGFDRGVQHPQSGKVLRDSDSASDDAQKSFRGTDITPSVATTREIQFTPSTGTRSSDHRKYFFGPMPQHESATDVPPSPAATIWPSKESRRSSGIAIAPMDFISSGIFLQPETHPITEEQLVDEVRGIYAGLVMVEKKCMEIDRQQSLSNEDLSDLQWQALIALHRTLLHEHHDFFLASNHPVASQVLRRLAERYSMPARMWRYGIHSFLELLRRRLPDSLDHMLTFIYMAYSMMTLLLESVPSFEETWIECLGDLARYRMAVEEHNLRDREVWSGVAGYWYNKAADKSPEIGRIQHHLAVLARPNILQQLFYYSKSLVSVQPFTSARDSILLLFNPLLDDAKPTNSRHPPIITIFVTAHGLLFRRRSVKTFIVAVNRFLSELDRYVGRIGAVFREQGIYIASANYAAIFDYGQADSDILPMFEKKAIQETQFSDRFETARKFWATQRLEQPVISQRDDLMDDDLLTEDARFNGTDQVISFASYLAFSTLDIILERIGDKNVLPNVHISLAFLWTIALIPSSMMYIQADVPWARIVSFLNTLIRPDTDMSKIENESFHIYEIGASRQLPEDFLIRGQAWSQLYFPENFFQETLDEEERAIELPSVVYPRTYRCLWLGVRIASFQCWITYDSRQKQFSLTPFAHELEKVSRKHESSDRRAKEASSSSEDNDTNMTGI